MTSSPCAIAMLATAVLLGCGSTEPDLPKGERVFTAEISGDFVAEMAGSATFEPGTTGDFMIAMLPIQRNRQQEIFLFFRGGLPDPGVYSLGHYTTATEVFARVPRREPDGGDIWESVSGVAHITAASNRGVIGTLEFTASWGGEPTIAVTATFSAAPVE